MNLAQLKAQGVAYIDLLNNTLVRRNDYGYLIQMVIARRDISSAQVAREMGFKQSTVSSWVTNRCSPSEQSIAPIKQWLSENGVTV